MRCSKDSLFSTLSGFSTSDSSTFDFVDCSLSSTLQPLPIRPQWNLDYKNCNLLTNLTHSFLSAYVISFSLILLLILLYKQSVSLSLAPHSTSRIFNIKRYLGANLVITTTHCILKWSIWFRLSTRIVIAIGVLTFTTLVEPSLLINTRYNLFASVMAWNSNTGFCFIFNKNTRSREDDKDTNYNFFILYLLKMLSSLIDTSQMKYLSR